MWNRAGKLIASCNKTNGFSRLRAFSNHALPFVAQVRTADGTVDNQDILLPAWIDEAEQSCRKRKKAAANFPYLRGIAEELRLRLSGLTSVNSESASQETLWQKYILEIMKLPNRTHPSVEMLDEDQPKLMETIGKRRDFVFKPSCFEDAVEKLNGLRLARLDHLCPERSYYFAGLLADVERCIISHVIERLIKSEFELLSVPESIDTSVLESCGMIERGEHNQIYRVLDRDHGELALAGTSEMTIAAYLANRRYKYHELPRKYAAVSRCFRAEISGASAERGLYRVHEFTKVEMFAVTACESIDSAGICEESETMLNDIVNLQKEIVQDLELHALVYDMPAAELGLPAFRKIDIEAWMPGRDRYGEISSASNCTDYQARRLNISYTHNGQNKFCHTLNGTACAVPRLLISLVEQHQLSGGGFRLPVSLQAAFKTEALDRTPYLMNIKFRRPMRKDPVLYFA